MHKLVELNCQNFECDSNKKGDCLQGNVQMRPVTEKGLQIDRLICVQATRKEEETGPPAVRGGGEKDR